MICYPYPSFATRGKLFVVSNDFRYKLRRNLKSYVLKSYKLKTINPSLQTRGIGYKQTNTVSPKDQGWQLQTTGTLKNSSLVDKNLKPQKNSIIL